METNRQQEQCFLTDGLSRAVYSWNVLGMQSVQLEKKMVSFNWLNFASSK